MVNYVLVAVIAIAAAGIIAAWFALRARQKKRMPSLNTLRAVTRRGVQRNVMLERSGSNSQDALDAMISDLSGR